MHLSRKALRRGAENTRPRSCRWRTLLCSRSPCVSLSLSLSLSHSSLLLLQAKPDIIMATVTASAAGNGGICWREIEE
ncbi:hypothetical protein DPX16_17258 [Anabarilius grahami]|uniref:Uncharacterized protein n=1 Tax=Anabarilius grahami TaxID=495550 RepID=A0A3N0YB39_ANAGA|nr:hypothetical protein DPX16_17258 [Anabarilius grahami]